MPAKLPRYIQRRDHNHLYAVMEIPKTLRGKFGKRRRFVRSLGTTDLATARRRIGKVVSEFLEDLERARGGADGGPAEQDAAFFRKALRHASGVGALDEDDEPADERAVVMDQLYERVKDIRDRATAEAFVRDATAIETDAHLDEWIASLRVTPAVRDTRRTDVMRLAAKFPMLHQIERPALNRWAIELLKEGAAIGSVTRILGAHRLYWRFLQSIAVVADDRNPFDRMDIGRQARREASRPSRRAFTTDEIVRLHSAALEGGKQYAGVADLIDIGRWTGMRLEEICSLKVAAVAGDRITVRSDKGGGSVREVPIHPKLAPVMARLCQSAGVDGYVLSDGQADKHGRRSHRLARRFANLKKAMGCGDDASFHGVRKCFATSLAHAEIPDAVIQSILGHRPTSLLHRVYAAGPTLEMKRTAIERLAY